MTAEGQVLVAGGALRKLSFRGPFTTDGLSAGVFMFDPVSATWVVKSKLDTGRAHFLLAVVDE